MNKMHTSGVNSDHISNSIGIDERTKQNILSGHGLSTYLDKAYNLGKKLCLTMSDVASGKIPIENTKSLVHDINKLGLPGNYRDVPQALEALNKFVLVLGNFNSSKATPGLMGFDLIKDSLDARSDLHNMHAVLSRADDALSSLCASEQMMRADVLRGVGSTYIAFKDTAKLLGKNTRFNRFSRASNDGASRLDSYSDSGSNSNLGSDSDSSSNRNYKADDKSTPNLLGSDVDLGRSEALRSIGVYIANIFGSYEAVLSNFGDLSHTPVGAVYAFNMSIALQVGGNTVSYLNNLSDIQTQVINPLSAGVVATASAMAQAFTKVWTQLQTDVAGTGSPASSSLNNVPFLMNNSTLQNMYSGMFSSGLTQLWQGYNIGGGNNGDWESQTVCPALNGVLQSFFGAQGPFLGVCWGGNYPVSGGGDGVYLMPPNQLGSNPINNTVNSVAQFNSFNLNPNANSVHNPDPLSSNDTNYVGAMAAYNTMFQAIGFPYTITYNGSSYQLVPHTWSSPPAPTQTLPPIPKNPGSNPNPSWLSNSIEAYCANCGLGSPLVCWEALQNMACVDLGDNANLPPSEWTTNYLQNNSITNCSYIRQMNTGSNFKMVFIDSSVQYTNPPANAIAIPHDLFELINKSNITNTDFIPTTNSVAWPYVGYKAQNAGGPIAYLNINDTMSMFANALNLIGTFVNTSGSNSLFGTNGIFSNVSTMQSLSQSSIQQLGNNVTQAPNQALSVSSDVVQELQTIRDQLNTLLQGLISGAVI